MNEDFLHKKLAERKAQNSFRQLQLPSGKIDFCSNDYLGIVKNGLLHSGQTRKYRSGSTGSRLLTGNYALIEETEAFIAGFHRAEAALIFNSGYDANTGLLSSIPQKGDTVLYDQFSHASLRDGIRLSYADSFSFLHNDLGDLETKLKKAPGIVFVVTESVFSMDGDYCPLGELVMLCEQYGAKLVVDEAHATGVIGENGEGLVQKLGFESSLFARIHTFGKACGTHGAVVLGSNNLRDWLINFARSFIYSTALPEQTIADIKTSYEIFPQLKNERAHLRQLIETFQKADFDFQRLESNTPIQGIVVPGNEQVKGLATQLQEKNLDSRPILYPSVPKGWEWLRIVLHSFNTQNELELLVKCLENSR